MARSRPDSEDRFIELLVNNEDISGLHALCVNPGSKGSQAAAAFEALLKFNSPEAWEAISDAAVNCDGMLAERLTNQLGGMLSNSSACKALSEAMRNPHMFVRSSAVRAFSQHASSASLAALLRASRDPEPSIRRMAMRSLMRFLENNPAVLAEVRQNTAEGIFELLDEQWAMELLSDAYPESIRILAATRLGAIGGEEATVTLAAVLETVQGRLAEACWRALESSGQVSEHLLFPLIVSGSPANRARALSIYGRFVGPEGEGLIQGLCADKDPSVRRSALIALTRIIQERALPRLTAGLKDPDNEVRLVCIDLLGQIPDSSPELVDAVETSKGEIKRRALIVLANRGVVSPSLVMPYIEFLLKGAGCTDLSQRDYLDGLSAAAKTLAQSQLPEALLALTSMVRSVIRRLRRIAIEAVMLFDPADRADALHSLMDTYDTDVLKNIALGLHEINDKRAPIPLIRATLECKGRPAVKAKEALFKHPEVNDYQFLISCLKLRWPSVRRFSAERLKVLKDRRAVPALIEASKDADIEVQLAVFEALSPFAGDDESVKARMLDALSYGDISVRQAACEALGEARCKDAVPDLVKAIHNTFLRPRATEALKRIGDRKGYLALKRLERRETLFRRKPKDTKAPKDGKGSKSKKAGAH